MKLTLFKQYTWEKPDRELGFGDLNDAKPEELVPLLLEYEEECLEDIRGLNKKLANYKFQIRDPEIVKRLQATKKDITDTLSGYTETLWSRLQSEGTSFQTMLMFDKEPQVDLDFSNLRI